jgi:hypothetical protein
LNFNLITAFTGLPGRFYFPPGVPGRISFFNSPLMTGYSVFDCVGIVWEGTGFVNEEKTKKHHRSDAFL